MLHDILLNLPFLRHAPKSLIEVMLLRFVNALTCTVKYAVVVV